MADDERRATTDYSFDPEHLAARRRLAACSRRQRLAEQEPDAGEAVIGWLVAMVLLAGIALVVLVLR